MFHDLFHDMFVYYRRLVIGCTDILKRMSRTLTKVGPTLRKDAVLGRSAQCGKKLGKEWQELGRGPRETSDPGSNSGGHPNGKVLTCFLTGLETNK
jgi:hypothetical protein